MSWIFFHDKFSFKNRVNLFRRCHLCIGLRCRTTPTCGLCPFLREESAHYIISVKYIAMLSPNTKIFLICHALNRYIVPRCIPHFLRYIALRCIISLCKGYSICIILIWARQIKGIALYMFTFTTYIHIDHNAIIYTPRNGESITVFRILYNRIHLCSI